MLPTRSSGRATTIHSPTPSPLRPLRAPSARIPTPPGPRVFVHGSGSPAPRAQPPLRGSRCGLPPLPSCGTDNQSAECLPRPPQRWTLTRSSTFPSFGSPLPPSPKNLLRPLLPTETVLRDACAHGSHRCPRLRRKGGVSACDCILRENSQRQSRAKGKTPEKREIRRHISRHRT